MIKVSVLMPVFNASEYLSEAINSIINQTFSDWELIILNDGSTDNSEDIVLSYNDKRIRYIRNEENRGIIYSRKLMIDKAEGQYLAFLDSDDIALPERLKVQAEFLDKNSEYGMCGTWGILIDEKGQEIRRQSLESEYQSIRCALLFGNTFIQSSIMIRRSLLAAETYDPHFSVAEDYDLWCRLSFTNKLTNIPEYLTKYRVHTTGATQSDQSRMYDMVEEILERELINLGIYASESELHIHMSLLYKDAYNIPEDKFVKPFRVWMRKLTGANQLCRVYNHDIFRATVCYKWIACCKKRKAYFRMFILPVSLNMKAFSILIRMLFRANK